MMQKLSASVLALAASAGLAAPAAAQTSSGGPTLLLDWRTRYESYDPGPVDAEALTTRVRVGVEAPITRQVSVLAEVEAVGAIVDDYADGAHPRPGHATIPDPETIELNRAQVAWTPAPTFAAVVGRQRIILNNARFVGNSGWRQNEQTFDAVKLNWKPVKSASLTYVYIDDVRRTLGREHPQGVWRSDSHLLQADLDLGVARASAYRYQLDFSNAPTQASTTMGLRLAGKRALTPTLTAGWELEVAEQTDAGRNPADFKVDYALASASLSGKAWMVGAAWEQLGGDSHNSFQTPLATLHVFQGLSDVIGATPVDGLRDVAVRGNRTFSLARPLKLAAELHDFRDDSGDRRYGWEADAVASVQMTKAVMLEVGVARFETRSALYPDATRTWLTVEFKR